MTEWYREFFGAPSAAIAELDRHYEPYREILSGLRGHVLDLGGGLGISSKYLPPETLCVVADPSEFWQSEWCRPLLKNLFPADHRRPVFVRCLGEKLPFADATFDAVLAFWSLNHADDPLICVREAYRVLKPNGEAIFVLEDMEPSWVDCLRRGILRLMLAGGMQAPERLYWNQEETKTLKKTVIRKLSRQPWPLQADHVRIDEAMLKRQLRRKFAAVERRWRQGFLSYRLMK